MVVAECSLVACTAVVAAAAVVGAGVLKSTAEVAGYVMVVVAGSGGVEGCGLVVDVVGMDIGWEGVEEEGG